MTRNYSNIAFDTTLSAGIAAGDLTCVVSSAAGWPAVPFAAVLDPGSLTVEPIVCDLDALGLRHVPIRVGVNGSEVIYHG